MIIFEREKKTPIVLYELMNMVRNNLSLMLCCKTLFLANGIE